MSGIALQATPNGVLTDQFGNALSGRRVYVYVRDTTTQTAVYTDEGLTSLATQPLTIGPDGGIPGYISGEISTDYVDAATGERRQGLAGVPTALNVRNFGAIGDGITDDTAAFQALRDAIKASRIADPDAGAGFHLCTLAGYVPPGRYLVTSPGALMDDTGDAASDGTFGYDIFGQGEASRIIYTPSVQGALFRNMNQFIFPRVRSLLLVGGNNKAVCEYSASGGVAQGFTYEDVIWWGTWYEGIQLDVLATSLGAATVTIATPAVVTVSNHGLSADQTVKFTTTGQLPAGLIPGTVYWVLSSGLTTNTFQVAAAKAGSAIATTGSQSGTHTAYAITANGNDSHSFIRCRDRGTYGITPLGAPAGPSASAQGSGGTFAAGTYYWQITAVGALGETVPSSEVSATIVLNGSCLLSWSAVAGAASYRIYRASTTGLENVTPALVAQIAGYTTTYTDTGAATVVGFAPSVDQSGNGAWFHSGVTPGVPNQDQAIAHETVACNLEPGGGHSIRLDYGGHFKVDGGSMIQRAGTNNRLFYIPNSGAHELGTCHLDVRGVRFEIHTSTGKIIACRWQFGTVIFDGVSSDGHTIPTNQIVATFDNAGNCGPIVIWRGSTLTGQHEYIFRKNSGQGGVSRAKYQDCEVYSYADLQGFIVSTDGDKSFQAGYAWEAIFDDCRGGAAAGSTFASAFARSSDANYNWLSRMAGEGTKRVLSIHDPFGALPQDPGSSPGTVTATLPTGAIVTDVHFWMAAKGGGSTATSWSYVLTHGAGTTIATLAPGTSWAAGWEHHEKVWVPCFTDAARDLTVTVTGVNDTWTQAFIIIEYLPGG